MMPGILFAVAAVLGISCALVFTKVRRITPTLLSFTGVVLALIMMMLIAMTNGA